MEKEVRQELDSLHLRIEALEQEQAQTDAHHLQKAAYRYWHSTPAASWADRPLHPDLPLSYGWRGQQPDGWGYTNYGKAAPVYQHTFTHPQSAEMLQMSKHDRDNLPAFRKLWRNLQSYLKSIPAGTLNRDALLQQMKDQEIDLIGLPGDKHLSR